MRFALLGSGSRGNATVVEHGATRLLIDCGFSLKETEYRLGRLGLQAADIDAVLVTHEHHDHIGGVGPLARRYGMPVWLTPGTLSVARKRLGQLPRLEALNCHQPFAVGDIEITPFPVPHDAREPSQFVFSDGARRLGLLTDLGHISAHVQAQLQGLDALILEANHDLQMLADGPYPPSLQARVGGAHGHLSNGQAGQLLASLEQGRLQHVTAAHLSEKNNLPKLAVAALSEALGCEAEWIAVAEQAHGLDWRQIA